MQILVSRGKLLSHSSSHKDKPGRTGVFFLSDISTDRAPIWAFLSVEQTKTASSSSILRPQKRTTESLGKKISVAKKKN